MDILFKAVLTSILITFFFNATAQTKVDSIVMKYLNTKPNIPKPFYKIKRKGKTGVIYTNFYTHPNAAITTDSLKIITYRFGSSQSHAPIYFLIMVNSSKYCNYRIIDDKTVEEGITNLLHYIQPYSLSNSQKAQLLNQLTFSYY